MRTSGWLLLLALGLQTHGLAQEAPLLFQAIDTYLGNAGANHATPFPKMACAGRIDALGRPPLDYVIEQCTDPSSGRLDARTAIRLSRILLSCGADIEAGDLSGSRPIHLAAAAGSAELIHFLADHHAHVNALDSTGRTALMIAIASQSPNPDVVRELLAYHASVEIPVAANTATPRFPTIQDSPIARAIHTRLEALDDARQGKSSVFGESTALERSAAALAIIAALLNADARPDAAMRGPTGFPWPVLFATVRGGDLDATRLLVLHGASVHGTVDDGLSLMRLAVAADNAELIIYLASLGLNAQEIDKQGTPLLCMEQGTATLTALLNAGADPNARRRDRLTALHLAVDSDNAASIGTLLDHGAVIDITVEANQPTACVITGQTPLLRALSGHHGAAVLALLRRGARLTARLDSGESALHLAAQWSGPLITTAQDQPGDLPHDGPSLIRLIAAEGADVRALTTITPASTAPGGRNALHMACLAQLPENAIALLAVGADPTQRDGAGCTPGLLAIQVPVHRQQWLTIFSTAGAPIDPEDVAEVDLLEAISAADSTKIRALLANEPVPLRTFPIPGDDPDAGQPLHLAIATHQAQIVTMVLAHGADPNAGDNRGREALHRAIETNQPELVAALCRHGAEINARTHVANGVTPLGIALGQSASAVKSGTPPQRIANIAALLANGANANAPTGTDRTPLQIAVNSGNLPAVTALLEHDADVTIVDHERHTLIHLLSWNSPDSVQIAYLLVAKGIDPNRVDTHGSTALHLLARNGKESSIRTLISLGCTVAPIDKRGRTPLHIAAESGNLSALGALLNAGSPIDARDATQSTPLMLAAENGQVDVVLHLLAHHAEPDGIAIDAVRGWRLLKDAQHYKLQALLDQDADAANARLTNGETLLMRAADRGDSIGVRLLLAHGASPLLHDKRGRTALMHAVLAPGAAQIEITSDLLQAGADPDQADHAGMTSSMLLAAKPSGKNNPRSAATIALLKLLQAGEAHESEHRLKN